MKTGPISTGTISAATLPTVRLTAAGTIPVTGLDTTPWTIQFSGDIQVINSTCNVTSSPNVPMGKYAIENYFGSGKPNNTPWVPFSITLSGCAIFNGNYTGSTNAGVFDGDVTYGVRQTNYLQTTFAPVNGVIDDAKGIMRLQSVTNSATGVGIQLAQDTGAVDPVLFSFSAGFRQNVSTSMPGSFAIPMKARYIQAGSDPLKPGLANSSTVFTINYR